MLRGWLAPWKCDNEPAPLLPYLQRPSHSDHPEPYTVTAHVSGDDRAVNALAAFTCDRGHIFFVRSTDLVAEAQPRINRQSA